MELEDKKYKVNPNYWVPDNQKESQPSEQCRLAANELFKTKEFEDALEYYNASLCYAPLQSTDMAQTYANRSAVYCEMGKYAFALENIKFARENGFPSEKMAQLDVREEKCKKLMEEFGPDKNSEAHSFFKLSYPPNKKIPFIVDCLELRTSEKYGRHIVTTADLKAGDIIAIESPTFAWPSETVVTCLYCAKKNCGNLIPCFHCTKVMYCSEECRKKGESFHLSDEFDESKDRNTRMSFKMLLDAVRVAGGVNELLELLKDNENKTIFDFDFSDPNDPSYEKNMLIALNGLCKDAQNQKPIVISSEQFLNFPPINEKKITAEERNQLLKFITNQLQLRLTNHPGDSIYLFASLLNHSCFPHVIPIKLDEKSVLFVIRPAKAGEQIFNSYGPQIFTDTKEERRLMLEKYPFKCDCEACANDYHQPFPKKDPSFSRPEFVQLRQAKAIKEFKKNCKYINENAEKMPCYEVATLMAHNSFLIECIKSYVHKD